MMTTMFFLGNPLRCSTPHFFCLLTSWEEPIRTGPNPDAEVVQHVMEHSSRPGDRQHVMNIIRKNILSLSCGSDLFCTSSTKRSMKNTH